MADAISSMSMPRYLSKKIIIGVVLAVVIIGVAVMTLSESEPDGYYDYDLETKPLS